MPSKSRYLKKVTVMISYVKTWWIVNDFEKNDSSPVHDPLGAVWRCEGHVVCQVHACPGPLRACFIFSITQISHIMIGWKLYTLLGWIGSVSKQADSKEDRLFCSLVPKGRGIKKVINEPLCLKNSFENLWFDKALAVHLTNSRSSKLHLYYLSAETCHSRINQPPLSQSGKVIPMAPAGAKGGPPGLGIGCEASICYEMTSKVDNTTVCDGLFKSLTFMTVKSVTVTRIYLFSPGLTCIV